MDNGEQGVGYPIPCGRDWFSFSSSSGYEKPLCRWRFLHSSEVWMEEPTEPSASWVITVQSHAKFFWELIFLAMLQRALSRSKASFSSVFPWNCLTWSRSLSSPSHSEIIERLFRYTRGRRLCELEYTTLSPDIYKNTLQILRIILWQCRKWHTLYSFRS